MDTSKLEIETERLLIRGITLEYKDHIFREFTPEISKYMVPKPADKIEETVQFIENSIVKNKLGQDFQAVIVSRGNHEFMGCCGIQNADSKIPELGIWIKKSAHGKGYGKEAVTALKGWSVKNLEYEYLSYPVTKQNLASRRIPEALGGKIAREYDEANQSGVTLHFLEYRIYSEKPGFNE